MRVFAVRHVAKTNTYMPTDPANAATPNAVIGHFTQLVWESSTVLGFGWATTDCNDFVNCKAIYVVARYAQCEKTLKTRVV